MHTDTHTVQVLFGQPRRHVVPLFQRPYVWQRERQWEPLIEDLFGMAEDLTAGRTVRPHFMGAIVLEAEHTPTGQIDTRLVVDGQQRLTTLALLMEAFRDVCGVAGLDRVERALQPMTRNDDPLNDQENHQYKVWPTNADRDDFQAIMEAGSPDELVSIIGRRPNDGKSAGEGIADAYGYFYDTIAGWLEDHDEEDRAKCAEDLTHAIREKLRLVVIDLGQEDDPQAIFETLNARGTALLPTDLVKNHLFRAAQQEGRALRPLYDQYWIEFDREHGWWRGEIGPGHARRARVDVFLGHYLTARKRATVSTSRLYDTFKDFAETAGWSTEHHLSDIRRLAGIYKTLDGSGDGTSREELFFHRLDTMDVSTVYPFLLHLFAEHGLKTDEIRTILSDLESFLVRRMLCRLNTRGYNTLFVDLIAALEEGAQAGTPSGGVRKYLLRHEGDAARWPRDGEFKRAIVEEPVYGRVRKDRVQMILEAIERSLWTEFGDVSLMSGLQLEHIMPRQWRSHWPLGENSEAAGEARDRAVDLMGNLTLVSGGLNASMSNAPWETKRTALQDHSMLRLTNRLLANPDWQDTWNEDAIAARGQWLYEQARSVWSVPV